MRNTSVQSVERAVAILLYLADRPHASLRELAAHIGCSRTSVYRLLGGLSKGGLVEMTSDGRPEFGPAAVRIYGAWRRQTDVRRIAHPLMLELRDRLGETISLHIRQADTQVCVECVESRSAIRRSIAVGDTAPLLRGASSKLFLAAMSDEELDALASRCQPNQAKLLAQVRQELPQVRQQEFATSFEEWIPGAAAVACPLYNAAGEMFATLNLSGPVQRVTPAFVAETALELQSVTRSISARLGHTRSAAGGQSWDVLTSADERPVIPAAS